MSKLFTPEFYLEDLRTKFQKLQRTGFQYHLSYSGGKDSHLLFWFMREWLKDNDQNLYEWCLQNVTIVGVNTYLEHPQILARMKKNCDVVLLPKMKPMEIKEKYGTPCFSKEQDMYIYSYQHAISNGRTPCRSALERVNGTYIKRYCISKRARIYLLSGNAHMITNLCCKFLKKGPLDQYEKETGRKAITGVRSSESAFRKLKYKSCFTKNHNFTPLHDLDDGTLEAIIKEYNIEVPEIYKHIGRTGCMGCPYGTFRGETQKELSLISPAQRKFVCELFKESYEVLGIDTSSDLPFVEVAHD